TGRPAPRADPPVPERAPAGSAKRRLLFATRPHAIDRPTGGRRGARPTFPHDPDRLRSAHITAGHGAPTATGQPRGREPAGRAGVSGPPTLTCMRRVAAVTAAVAFLASACSGAD